MSCPATKVRTSQSERYKALKSYSTNQEKDQLIIDVLTDDLFRDKQEQITKAFNKWETIQACKALCSLSVSISKESWKSMFAKFIKEIAPLNFTVGYRQMSETNEVEYWVICKEKDYSLLDKISELCIEYENKLPFRVGIVFTSIRQFVGKDIVTFEEEM